jgi:hypothetical protein
MCSGIPFPVARKNQKEPVVVGHRYGQIHVAKYMPGRHDIQNGEPGDNARVIQDQPLRDAGPAVVADQLELPEAELAHEPRLVASHGPLGVSHPRGVRNGLAGVPVATQVGHDDRVVLGEAGRNMAPCEMVLRIAMQ